MGGEEEMQMKMSRGIISRKCSTMSRRQLRGEEELDNCNLFCVCTADCMLIFREIQMED